MSEAHHSSLCQVLGQCRQASSSELTFTSPPSPHTVFAQFFPIRFPHHLGAWIPGTGQVNKRFASPHFSGYYIVQQAREERGTRESLLSSPCLPPFASLSRFALNFVLFCLYKLFWTQACPEACPIQQPVKVGHTTGVYVPYSFRKVVWVLLRPARTDQ